MLILLNCIAGIICMCNMFVQMFHEHAPERKKESILSSLKKFMDPSSD